MVGWVSLQESFHRLLYKKDGKRAEWEYPFAVAGINISFMLVQMLDLQSGKTMRIIEFICKLEGLQIIVHF